MNLKENLQIQLDKLNPADFEVLILRASSWVTANEDTLYTIRKWADGNLPGKQILLLEGDVDIQTMSEKDMNQLGWYRKKKNARETENTDGVLEKPLAGL